MGSVQELLSHLEFLAHKEFWSHPLMRALLVLLLGWVVHRAVRLLLRRFENRLMSAEAWKDDSTFDARKRVETLVALLRQVFNIVLIVLLALVMLTQLGVQVGPLIAGAGIVGVAVGFGAQYLVRDIITGFFMVVENQIRVGDVVTINGTGGLVESLTLRTVVLRDGSGVVHVFPHGSVTTLSNATREWSAYLFNISIALKEDPDHAITVMRRVAVGLSKDATLGPLMIAEPEIFGVDKLDGSGFIIQGRIKTRAGKQSDVAREFLKRLKRELEREGIDFPSTTSTLYLAPGASTLDPISAKPAEK